MPNPERTGRAITRRRPVARPLLITIAAVGAGTAAAALGAPDLARYFGFEQPRVVVVDDGVGPVIAADINGDGRTDLIAVNNRKSRIELYLQRATPLTDREVEQTYKVNELPPSPYYDRHEVSVAHRVTALQAFDVDGDGKLDLVYAGKPEEIVVLRQVEPLKFEVMSRRRERDLASTRSSFAIADVAGGPRPELIALVAGRIFVYPFSTSGALGEPTALGAGGATQSIVAFFVEDYDGDGMLDILGVIPEDPAPLRLWRQQPGPAMRSAASGGKDGVIGPELRFEMPALREVEPVRFPDRKAASIGVIERASRRIVFYDLDSVSIDATPATGGAEREVQAEVRTFPEGSSADRSVVVSDLDGDGAPDLLATNAGANQIVLYRQIPGQGLAAAQSFSAFKKPKSLAVGAWDEGGSPEVFVLSEEEKTVGVSRFDRATGRLSFPQPIQLATAGGTPVAMNHVALPDGPAVAVVVKDKRDYTLELHRPGAAGKPASAPRTIALEGVKRAPQTILPADIDHDGSTELLLLTPDEPMVVVRLAPPAGSAIVLTDKTMPQFGLVQGAGPDNTALLDVDGDGKPELLIADKNFVRACAFDNAAGWRVVDQVTVPDATTVFAGLAVLPAESAGEPASVVATDRANGRLLIMSPKFNAWRVTDTLRLPGFAVSSIYAGDFAGDGKQGLLVIGPDGFGVIRLAGRRAALESFAAYRSNQEDRLEHELSVGDVNGDGHVDVVVLDAKEQMCQILTFSEARKLYEATEFKVFETRLFTRGDSREFEPSDAIIADVTGDGAQDITLVVHDRLIVYPQMTRPK